MLRLVTNSDKSQMETQRNSVGTHNPDLTTLLSEGLVDDPTTTLRVLSLAGEIKVTRIRARNGKLVIAVDPDNDVELTEDMATHYSIPSASGDKAKLVRVDEGIKWTAGLSKAVIYLQSQYEYCGGYLSASVLGTRFCRIVMADSGHVILEVSSAFLIAATTTALRIHDFLNDQTNVASLPWDMCDDHPGAFPEHSWNTDAMDRLLQLHKVAADILTSHTASHADQPFCRLTPVRDLAGVRELLEEIASSSLPAPLDKDDDLRISRAVKGEPGPSALGLGPTTRSQTMSGATSESGIQRSTAPPAYHGQSDLQEDTTVRRWRESLPAVLDTSPGVPPILTSPPELAFEDGVIADDKEWDSVLEAHDMPMDLERGREWVRQHVAPDSDFESDDEGEHVLLADMLKALEERNVRVTLVDTDKMDRLVGAIEKAVCA